MTKKLDFISGTTGQNDTEARLYHWDRMTKSPIVVSVGKRNRMTKKPGCIPGTLGQNDKRSLAVSLGHWDKMTKKPGCIPGTLGQNYKETWLNSWDTGTE